ncbi:MAG TPA: hypothetical protein VHS35_01015 [Pseudonocardia sp.]|nr:hypothetical protein [Pseudonocardia sp.]
MRRGSAAAVGAVVLCTPLPSTPSPRSATRVARGGTPTAATGRVVGLGRDITASDENGTDAERLSGLIQVDAAVQAGDSGGPLYAGGAVIGIDTAAAAAGLRAGDTITAVGGVAVD